MNTVMNNKSNLRKKIQGERKLFFTVATELVYYLLSTLLLLCLLFIFHSEGERRKALAKFAKKKTLN